MGAKVKGGVEGGVNKINQKIDERTALVRYFRPGNVVQIVSKTSGKVVQLVEKDGTFSLDALGAEGAENANGCWTVVGEGNEASLHINNKYITVVDGSVKIKDIEDPATLGPEAKFHVTQDGIFIHLESISEKGRHLGFLASGELKSASVCVKDEDSKFGAKLIKNNQITEPEPEGASNSANS